jgi:hypothetical protein
MTKQNGIRCMRAIHWVLSAVLFLAPTASEAATFLGYFKGRAACPGAGSDFLREDFTLTMEPGTGTGVLTVVGMPQLDVATDWIVDGNWSYFSASFVQDGAVVFNGWIKSGKWMKGNVAIHDYLSGCVVVARLKAWLQ